MVVYNGKENMKVEKMKWWKVARRTVVFAAVACLAVAVVGCDDSDEDGDTPSIVGTWQSSGYPTDGLKVTINEGNTFDMHAVEPDENPSETTSSGTYSFDGTTLTLKFIETENDSLRGTTETHTIVFVDSSTITVDGETFTK